MSAASADVVCLCVKMGSRHSVLGASDHRDRLSQVTHLSFLVFCANAWPESHFLS